MGDAKSWELAKKPVEEFTESIRQMDLNVDKLVKFYIKHSCHTQALIHRVADDEDTLMNEDQPTLSPLASAKLELAIVLAINTCYWMYLVSKGIDPKKEPISKDLERVQLFMRRARDVEEMTTQSCPSAKRPKFYT